MLTSKVLRYNNDMKDVHVSCCCRSISVLTRCMQDPFMSRLLCNQQRSLRHDLPLGAYLLKPVQRIFKYQLLLQVVCVVLIIRACD